ncbi:unnamed protein product [Oppiella nova]|uniref:Uncharacterized protein n=1 Tax=Oppiella nova TaxID=334625 RepID=A0A7R9LI78_9ACAR|nr:unnamed protein product [Oppiella nova]CAG2163864.1 unnamed protein product [Oppiella nova]
MNSMTNDETAPPMKAIRRPTRQLSVRFLSMRRFVRLNHTISHNTIDMKWMTLTTVNTDSVSPRKWGANDESIHELITYVSNRKYSKQRLTSTNGATDL